MRENLQQSGVFSARQWWLVGAFILTMVLISAWGVRSSISGMHAHHFDLATGSAMTSAGERVVELRGVFKSKLSMHYASDQFGGPDTEAFAEQLRVYNPFVNSIGFFGVVNPAFRDNYEAGQSERYGFPIWIQRWDDAGFAHLYLSYKRHFPIESVDPMDSAASHLLGTDITSVDTIASTLNQAIGSGKGLIVPLPSEWPLVGDTLLIQPVYQGKSIPGSTEERREKHIGGVWTAIDLAPFFKETFSSVHNATVRFTVSTVDQLDLTLYESTDVNMNHGFDLGFGKAYRKQQWQVGESLLTMEVSSELTASMADIWLLFFSSLFAAMLAGTGVAMIYQRKVVQRERVLHLGAIEKERQNTKKTLESISDAVLTIDTENKPIYVNPTAIRWFSLEGLLATGESLESELRFVSTNNGTTISLSMLRSRLDSDNADVVVDVNVQAKEVDPEITFKLTLSMSDEASSGTNDYTLVLQNVSKERQLTATLERQAHRDPLTDCYNRYYFEKRLVELLNKKRSSSATHAVCYIDLDKFKIVNDTCGHGAGDRLLCELTVALQARLRKDDIFARLGGDEFGIIFLDVDPDELEYVANHVYEHFQNAVFEDNGHVFPVRASIGVTLIDEHFSNLEQVQKAADVACYKAKSEGRNQVVFSSSDTDLEFKAGNEANWYPTLEEAIEKDQFTYLLQPVYDIQLNTQTTSFDVLPYLTDADGELIEPDRYKSAAERYELMPSLDRLSLKWAISALGLTSEDAFVRLSVRLSAQSIADDNLPEYIEKLLKQYGVHAEQLQLEFTEADALSNFSAAFRFCLAIHKIGCQVVLGEFGTGLSSFSGLKDLDIDVLKISSQYTNCVVSDHKAFAIVQAMMGIARAKGVTAMATGIQDSITRDAMVNMGISFAQGDMLGKAIELESIEHFNQPGLRAA